jgi:hypothetical protein
MSVGQSYWFSLHNRDRPDCNRGKTCRTDTQYNLLTLLQLEKFDYLCALINKVIPRSVVSHFAQSAYEFISAGIRKLIAPGSTS